MGDDPYLSIPNAFLYDENEIINKAHEVASKTHMCVYCHALFNPLDSLGKWECCQHTGSLEPVPDSEHDRLRWSCCHKLEGVPRFCHNEIIVRLYRNTIPTRPMPKVYTPEGCVRADHRLCPIWPSPDNLEGEHPAYVRLNNIAGLVPFITDITQRPGFDPVNGILKRWDFKVSSPPTIDGTPATEPYNP